MLPITGPIQKITSFPATSPKMWLKMRQTYKQAEPYNLNLPYRAIHWRALSHKVGTRYDAGSYGGSHNSPVDFDTTGDPYYAYFTSYENATVSKAVSKFNRGQAQRASMGVAVVQYSKAVTMMVKRTKQLYDVFRSLKRFDLKAASNALGLPLWKARKRHQMWVRAGKRGPYSIKNEDIWNKDWTKTKRRERAHAVSNLWLEFSFGWGPLVDDVQSAIQIISDGVPVYAAPLKAGASSAWAFKNTQTTSDEFWKYSFVGDHKVTTRVTVGGMLTVTNSNKALRSQLGFTNLGLIAYETVPFSFVANYFFNIEQYLQQFTQYDGVSVTQSWYTIVWDDTVKHTISKTSLSTGETTVLTERSSSAVSMKRIIGSLPKVKLGYRHAYHNGIKRAFNNVSLLTQLFINKR